MFLFKPGDRVVLSPLAAADPVFRLSNTFHERRVFVTLLAKNLTGLKVSVRKTYSTPQLTSIGHLEIIDAVSLVFPYNYIHGVPSSYFTFLEDIWPQTSYA
jgi:hypothetical protein